MNELIQQFRQAIVRTGNDDPKVANNAADDAHRVFKLLRQTDEGRRSFMALMSDDDPHVRCAAAARSLSWAPDSARAVLVALREGDGPASFDAKWTLIEFDKGRLSFDYY